MEFRRASKQSARLRLALIGPAGSGKTYSALAVASGLAGGNPIAVIDTERGSASKYADTFAFDVLELESFHPQRYVEAIQAAENAGYGVLVIDSLSHAWMGRDGALEMVDKAAKRQGGNSFGAWRDVTPLHNQLVDAMIGSRLHIIVTLRAKTEYVQERDERTGRTQIRKVGLAPVQRDGLEYEFDVVGDMTQDNDLIITKTRCSALRGATIHEPGENLAETLRDWLGNKPQVTPEQAKEMFWTKFSAALGGTDWQRVCALIGDDTYPVPVSVADWRAAFRAVDAALTEEAAQEG